MKDHEIARIRYGALRDAENIARLFNLGTPDGHAIADSIRKLAEAERAGQTATPSVEQAERGAYEEAFRRNFEFPEHADQATFRKGWEAGIMQARAAPPAQTALTDRIDHIDDAGYVHWKEKK